ncbi:hypothetical protein GCM10009868_09730 [Terrabacter aerolatus]|uniref:Uncharacterized protein n=1 Tax=Terrabacter aerolatus TaxID=422442 RepID=A0A512D5L9_9MICO|nr:hypothetical protein TAE01_33900 [Terrabacter aerolatus]
MVPLDVADRTWPAGADGPLEPARLAAQVLEVGVGGQGQGHDGLLSSCPRALIGPKGGRTACCSAPGRLSPFPRTGGDLDATASVRPRAGGRQDTAYAIGFTPPTRHPRGGRRRRGGILGGIG